MLKHTLPVALALALLAPWPGVPAAVAQQTARAVDWDDWLFANLRALTSEQRDYAQAYRHALWLRQMIALGEWDDAEDELEDLREDFAEILEEDEVPASVKAQVRQLQSVVAELEPQLEARRPVALSTANTLVNAFHTTTNRLVASGWLERPPGGGAGR